MATHGGPNLVDEGLVFWIDAGQLSFTSGSTTIDNMASNNEGELFCTVTGSYNEDPHYWSFDHTQDRIELDSEIELGVSCSIEMWGKKYAGSQIYGTQLYSPEYHTAGPNNNGVQLYFVSNKKLQFATANSQDYRCYVDFSETYTDEYYQNGINHLVITRAVNDNVGYTANECKLYINGVLKQTLYESRTASNGVASTTFPNKVGVIGRDSNESFRGALNCMRLYRGKTLSAQEVQQNFNAVKNKITNSL